MSEIKIEKIEIKSSARKLSDEWTLEEVQSTERHYGPVGSPKIVRWLATFITWIKVEKSLVETLTEELVNKLTTDVDEEELRKANNAGVPK